MSKRVKDYVEVRDFMSLDAFVERLLELRDSLPEGADAQVKMRGDDVFGRHLSISYLRPQSEEEAACDARYADAYRQSRERELSKLQEELGVECHAPRPRRAGRLRIFA